MKPRLVHPNWWSLYLIIGLMMAAFFLEATAHLSENAHRMIEMAILLPGFGLIFLWLQFNEMALIAEEQEKQRQALHHSLHQILEHPNRWIANPEIDHKTLQHTSRPWQAWIAGLASFFTGFFHLLD